MMRKTAFLASAAALTFAAMMVGEAAAQMMGNTPYSFPARNPSFAAQAHITQKLNSNGGAGSGMDALSQYIINSSSTSIGNYNNVQVGDNANATVHTGQESNGNQDAESHSQTKNVSKSTTVNKSASNNTDSE